MGHSIQERGQQDKGFAFHPRDNEATPGAGEPPRHKDTKIEGKSIKEPTGGDTEASPLNT
jgi:hypothetical protein